MSLRDASKWTMRETQHINAGSVVPGRRSGWFGHVHQCVQEPRITRHLKCDNKTRSTEVTWRVDGVEVASFAAALEKVGAYIPVTAVRDI